MNRSTGRTVKVCYISWPFSICYSVFPLESMSSISKTEYISVEEKSN